MNNGGSTFRYEQITPIVLTFFQQMGLIKLRARMATNLAPLFNFFIKKRKIKVNKGSRNSVNTILIEKIVGKGRIGNSYKFFPTK